MYANAGIEEGGRREREEVEDKGHCVHRKKKKKKVLRAGDVQPP